jgi:hypothetical protein
MDTYHTNFIYSSKNLPMELLIIIKSKLSSFVIYLYGQQHLLMEHLYNVVDN